MRGKPKDARIPMLDLSAEINELRPQLNAAIKGVIDSGQFIDGPDVKLLEEELAGYLHVRHAIAVNSGTDALVIGLRALGISPGDEVITSAFTFFATAEAISALGATPVFVDVDPETFNIDPTLIEAKLTKKTKAIIPVHLYGHSVPMDAVLRIATERNLKVLEDVAQAFSGEYRGAKLGSLGNAAALSFFPSKNLGAFGDGGLIATNDDEVAELARMLKAHGSKKKYHNELVGYNSRLDSLQAAILRVKLPRLEAATAARRQVAERYHALLAGLKNIKLPTEASYAKHSYHQYTIKVEGKSGSRDKLQKCLANQGIDAAVYYPIPLHQLPVYRSRSTRLPNTEALCEKVLSLPIWPQLAPGIQERIGAAVMKCTESP